MKKAELLFGAILLPVDYLLLIAAGCTAYFLRFQSSFSQIQPALYTIPFGEYVFMVAITASAWVVIFAFSGLYSMRSTRRLVEEVRRVFLACSTGVLLLMIVFFFQRELFSSRFIILAAYGLSMLYVTVGRISMLYLQRVLFRRGIGVRNVVLIGEGHTTKLIANELANKRALGLHIKLQFDEFTKEAKKKISDYHTRNGIDELIFTDLSVSKEKKQEMYDFCDEQHIVFKYAAALFDTQSTNISIQPIAGIPVIEVKRVRLDGWGRIVKRLFDIIGSLVLIIITAPVMLIAAIAIVIDSGFPIFFSRLDDGSRLRRVGQYGKPFAYAKFRSMKPKTDSLRYHAALQKQNMRSDSPLVKIKDDPRITRVGKILRRYSIDELPEFFLVLRGDMSLVGPRPHLPEEVAKYQKHHRSVLHMKPGITGMAQVSGRSDLTFEDEVRLDTFYMENWALWLDCIILIKTPLALLKSRRAL